MWNRFSSSGPSEAVGSEFESTGSQLDRYLCLKRAESWAWCFSSALPIACIRDLWFPCCSVALESPEAFLKWVGSWRQISIDFPLSWHGSMLSGHALRVKDDALVSVTAATNPRKSCKHTLSLYIVTFVLSENIYMLRVVHPLRSLSRWHCILL